MGARTLIFRKLKGLEEIVGLSVTHWLLGEDGWTFAPDEGVIPDPLLACGFCTNSTPAPIRTAPGG